VVGSVESFTGRHCGAREAMKRSTIALAAGRIRLAAICVVVYAPLTF
jgi:hypothetical protein